MSYKIVNDVQSIGMILFEFEPVSVSAFCVSLENRQKVRTTSLGIDIGMHGQHA